MSRTDTGTLYYECVHPDPKSDLWCELEIDYRLYREDGYSYDSDGHGMPDDIELDYDSAMVSYCGEPVQSMSIPHWVDWDKVNNYVWSKID